MKLRAALYARKSFEDKRESAPIEQQLEDCRNFAAQYNYDIVAEFSDGESGRCPPAGYESEFKDDKITNHFLRNIAKKNKSTRRSGLGELCQLIESGAVDIIVTRDIMRIARPKFKSRFFSWSQAFFEENGVRIHCIQDGLLNFSDKMTSLMTFVKQAMVDDELEKRSESSAKVISKLRRGGAYLSKAPFGYIKTGKQYTQHPVHAKTVALVFNLKEKGLSIAEIKNHLNKKGLKTQEGSTFLPQTVSAISRKSIYAGIIPDGHGGYIDCTNIKPIVDKNIFLKHFYKSTTFTKNKLANRSMTTSSLMNKLLVCGHCGDYFTSYSISDKNGRYKDTRKLKRYGCLSKKNKAEPCESSSLSASMVDTFFDPFCILGTLKEKTESNKARLEKEKLPELKKQLEQIKKRRTDLLDDYSIDRVFWKEATEKLSGQINELQQQITAIEVMPDITRRSVDRNVDSVKLTFPQKQKIIRSVFEKVVIQKVSIKCHFKEICGEKYVLNVPFISYKGKCRQLPELISMAHDGKILFVINGKPEVVLVENTDFEIHVINFSEHQILNSINEIYGFVRQQLIEKIQNSEI